MVYTIHTSVKGRARFKVKGLYRSDPLKEYLELQLSGREGISRVSVSILTGNVLIIFNSDNNINPVRKMEHSNGVNVIASLIEDIVREHKSNTVKPSVPTYAPQPSPSPKSQSRRRLRRLITHAEEQKADTWHLMEAGDVLKIFETSGITGLSSESVKERQKRFGPNILPESVPRSGFSIFIDQFKSLPVALLGIAAGVSIFTGGIADAVVILGVVVVNAVIGYTTESQAEKTIHSLMSLVRPSAHIIRDGVAKEIGAEAVVIGDVLILRPGSYVAADARLIDVSRLSIDESALTGESMPVVKTVQSLEFRVKSEDVTEIPLADRINMVYMGTLVTGGQGFAVVVATGRFTEIGKIQILVGEASPPETPMERQLNSLGSQLVLAGGVVCGLVFVIGILRGYGLLEMLKTSISLAVAAVPEGLPTLATTTLALGVRNMRRHNVLIRHLNSVETLGSVQTICLDKTGTLTLNRMSVATIYAGVKHYKISNGNFISGKKIINPYLFDELLKLIHTSILCNESEVIRQEGEYIVSGTSTENALIYLAISAGVDVEKVRFQYRLAKIDHRSENRNYMVTLHEADNGSGRIIAIKGSPTEVLPMCKWFMKDGNILPLDDADRLNIDIENERMAGDALRVLGVAYAFVDESAVSKKLGVKGSEFGVNTETELNTSCSELLTPNSELIWLGLVGMADPIRNGVPELIGRFHKAGIDTVMITGDQGPTAYAIGRELGLSKDEQLQILDSTHLANIEPDVLKALCERVHVFARVSPAHKLQIVQSLQSAGKVVAMTGDGINDSPALKAADIGIAMGHTGTDVAREVADVVLEDDNLETMIIAISQGRTIYNNIRKSVHFLLSTNLSEIMVMLTATAGGLGQPLSAMQLLWINLISDITPGLALALEPPEPDVLSQPPRNPGEPIVKLSDFKRIGFESAMLSAGTLSAYGYGILRYGIGQRAGTMAFSSLTIGQLLHAISCRSEKHSIFNSAGANGHSPLQPNRYLDAAISGSLILQALAMLIPGLRNLLGIVPISLLDGIVIGGSAALPLLINEGTKKTPSPSQGKIE